jgi:hypothetical protein
MQDANPCARFPAAGLGLRCSVSGLRPWRDGGREMGPSRPFVQTGGREPKAGNRIGCRVPDTRNPVPYCLTALLPYCLIALLPYCLIALLPYCLIA